MAREPAQVLSGLTIQAGQISGGPYSGSGPSYTGPTLAHDNYSIKHSAEGLVSMVNSGKGGNSGQSDSRFFIQLPADAGPPRPPRRHSPAISAYATKD